MWPVVDLRHISLACERPCFALSKGVAMYPTYQTPIAARARVSAGGWLFMGLSCMMLAALMSF